jgi:hypothetical protein
MSHTVVYNSELHIVESKLQGDMTLGEVEEIVTKIAKIAKEQDCRLIFIDFVKCYENYRFYRFTNCLIAQRTYSPLLALTYCSTSERMSSQKIWMIISFMKMSWSIVDKTKRCLLILTKQRNG